MKAIVPFDLDGDSIYIEVEDTPFDDSGYTRVKHDREKEGEKRFSSAIARIKPAAEAVLRTFSEMDQPDEIGLEFGLKFNARAGAVFTSVDSEATFKVSLKWTQKTKKETNKEQVDTNQTEA